MKKILPIGRAGAILLITFLSLSRAGASPVPTPTWAPLDPITQELLQKAGNLYYNYRRLGLHRFSCRVKIDTVGFLEQSLLSQGKDAQAHALENLRFSLVYDEVKGFRFISTGFPGTGNAAFDGQVGKIIQGAKEALLGYCVSWKAMAFQEAFDVKRSAFKFTPGPSGYEVDEIRDNIESLQVLDAEWKVMEAKVTNRAAGGQGTAVIRPQYLETPHGYLVNGLSTDVDDGYILSKIDTDYAVSGGFEMPSQITVDLRMQGKGEGAAPVVYHAKFDFSDFKIQ